MILQRVVQTAAVAVVAAGNDVRAQVGMVGLQSVVDDGDVDPGALVAAGPHALHVDVLAGPVRVLVGVAEVPLAAVPGIALRGGDRGAVVQGPLVDGLDEME